MVGDLKKWQRTLIRNSMAKYRQALENYYIRNKPLVKIDRDYKAFSLLSPPLGSAAARRRVRFIAKNVINSDMEVKDDRTIAWRDRTPHFITMAVTYKCQCDCSHCSAHLYKEEVQRNKSSLRFDELKNAIKQTISCYQYQYP